MSNRPGKIRLPTIQTPWEPVNRKDEPTLRYLVDVLRELERDKQDGADFSLSGATEGDILVANGSLVFTPRKTVPFSFGVGTHLSVTGNVVVTGNASIGGNLLATGTAAVTGNTLLKGTLGVSGLTTIGGALNVSGAAVVIGNHSVGGNLLVTGTATVTGNVTALAKVGVGITPVTSLHVDTGAAPPRAQFRVSSNDSGVFSVLNYAADNIAAGWDVEWNGAWIPKDATAGLWYKVAGMLGVYGNGGLTPGVGYNPTLRMRLDLANGFWDIYNTGAGVNDEVVFAFNNDVGRAAFELFSSGFSDPTLANKFSLTANSNLDGLLFLTAKSTASIDFYTAGSSASNRRMTITSGGFVGVGTNTPTTNFHVLRTDSGTNAVTGVVCIGRNSAGTSDVGFGSELRFQLKSSTTNDRDAGGLSYEWEVATEGSQIGLGRITAYYITTPREVMQWGATSSKPKVGFLGAPAAVQQTGGAASAGAAYTATEQAMIQAAYDCLRTFGFLS
jgi:hypothetical protein